MTGGQMKPPARGLAQPGQGNRFATAAGLLNLTGNRTARYSGGLAYQVTASTGETFRLVVTGRSAWALNKLREAGQRGCTPAKDPAPRWSSYVHTLRKAGVEIETVIETHSGTFPGRHGRYVLLAAVTLAERQP